MSTLTRSEAVRISRLGCMQKSMRVDAGDGQVVEHIEVWVPGSEGEAEEPVDAGSSESAESSSGKTAFSGLFRD